MEFVRNDLEKAYNDPDVSWIIVNGHRPYYSSFHNLFHKDWPPQTPFFLREAFEELFYEFNVDLYISGHIHAYERQYAVYKEKVTSKDYLNPLSTIYFVAGMAGNVEGHEKLESKKDYTAVYNDDQYGVSQVSVLNDTHLLWEFIGADDHSIIDSVMIKKGHWAK